MSHTPGISPIEQSTLTKHPLVGKMYNPCPSKGPELSSFVWGNIMNNASPNDREGNKRPDKDLKIGYPELCSSGLRHQPNSPATARCTSPTQAHVRRFLRSQIALHDDIIVSIRVGLWWPHFRSITFLTSSDDIANYQLTRKYAVSSHTRLRS